MVTVLLWAAAREAAGAPRVTVAAGRLADVIAELVEQHSALGALVPRCRLVVDGVVVTTTDGLVPDGATVEVLPPFAGG